MFIHKHFDYEKIKDFAPMVRDWEVLSLQSLFKKSAFTVLFGGLFLGLGLRSIKIEIIYSILITVLSLIYFVILRDMKKAPNKYRYSIYIFKSANLSWLFYGIFGPFLPYVNIKLKKTLIIICTMFLLYELIMYLWCLMLQYVNKKYKKELKHILEVSFCIVLAISTLILILLVSNDNKYFSLLGYCLMAVFMLLAFHGINQYMFTRVYRTEIEADIPPKRTVKRKRKPEIEENEQKE
ncbi:MAG: hypothetical protein Q8873_04475 [Bacillota bacterium]|nr:hypothetical protein [Bacillota bacterium]